MNNRYREEEKNEKNNLDENDKLDDKKIENEPVTEKTDEEDTESEAKESKKDKKLKKALEKLENEVEDLKSENKKLKDQYLRNLAETENYRKRVEDEKSRERKYASQRVLEKLVSVTDIFDKACNASFDDPMMKNFLMGFKMINDQIQNILSEEGVKKIKVEKMFDPRFQQAMETDYDETKEENEVLAVLRDGYMYKDRVLVYAMVKVNKKPKEENNNKQDKENKEE